MTREELFRAVGEIREDQIEAAETVKRQTHPWRRLGALAACLALVVTVSAAPGLRETNDYWRWTAIVKSFNPAIEVSEDPGSWKAIVQPFNPGEADSGGGAAEGQDGSEYWIDNPNRHTHPDYSSGVEIGEMNGPGTGDTMIGMSACLAWLSPKAIFAQDTAIFRGTIRELNYFRVEPDAEIMERYYTRAIIEVTDSIRGDLKEGETCCLLWLGARGYMSTSITGILEDLDTGDEAIFMPIVTDRDTGWKEGGRYFCYADLAELYLSEGVRYVFADTEEGLAFDQGTYPALAEAETLDDVAAYIRETLEEDYSRQTEVLPPEGNLDTGEFVFVEEEAEEGP